MYKKVIFLVVFIFTHMLLSAQKADDILGNWQSEKKDKIISIYKVDDLYYGKVIWIKDSALGTAKDRLDINNPNANLKKRKVVGINYLLSFAYYSDRLAWKDGSIYSFETGNTYSGKIHINEEGDLELTGYYGILWFLGRTQIWKRVK